MDTDHHSQLTPSLANDIRRPATAGGLGLPGAAAELERVLDLLQREGWSGFIPMDEALQAIASGAKASAELRAERTATAGEVAPFEGRPLRPTLEDMDPTFVAEVRHLVDSYGAAGIKGLVDLIEPPPDPYPDVTEALVGTNVTVAEQGLPDDPRVAKLPQWAQQRLRTAEQNADWWKAKACAGEAGPTNTSVQHSSDPTETSTQWLEDGATVLFRLAPDDGSSYLAGVLQATVVGDELELRTSGTGEVPAMLPEITNVARIRLVAGR